MFSYDLGSGAELRMLERRHGVEFLTLVEENWDFFGEWLGFTFEGIRRDGWRTNDEFVDIAVYSMLASDWWKLKISRWFDKGLLFWFVSNSVQIYRQEEGSLWKEIN